MRQLIRSDAGVSTIEFALMVPLLILLTVGILDIARALNATVVLGSASQEGAHYAIVNPTAAPSAIASAARQRISPLNGTAVSVTAEYYSAGAATFVPWPSAGIPASSPGTTGVLVRVTVSYPWTAVSAVVGSVMPGGGAAVLTSSSLMETRR